MRLLAVLSVCLALAAGGAQAATRDHAVSAFHGVDVSVPMHLQVVHGEAEGLRLEGDESALSQVEVAVEDGIVRIRARDRHARWKGELRGVLTARRVDSVALAGAGSIEAAELAGPSVKASLSGTGKVSVARLEAQQASLSISGAGSLRADGGKAGSLNVRISGSGDVEAPRVRAVKAAIDIAGTGNATVAASEALKARIAGVGRIGYYGDPRVEKRIGGAGSVSRLGAQPG